jgi:hypothetical protein
MAALTETQKVALFIAYGVISGYYLVSLYAAWIWPQLQRYWLLRPRWRGGVKASRFGVTTQAVFAFALSAFGFSKIYDHPWTNALGAVCLAAAMLVIIGWLADASGHADQAG